MEFYSNLLIFSFDHIMFCQLEEVSLSKCADSCSKALRVDSPMLSRSQALECEWLLSKKHGQWLDARTSSNCSLCCVPHCVVGIPGRSAKQNLDTEINLGV